MTYICTKGERVFKVSGDAQVRAFKAAGYDVQPAVKPKAKKKRTTKAVAEPEKE